MEILLWILAGLGLLMIGVFGLVIVAYLAAIYQQGIDEE
jgi:hypothetical protein